MNNQTLDNLLASKTPAVCWLGNISWLIASDGKLIATDLDLDRDYRLTPSPIPTEAIAPHLAVHFITHEHEDHFSSITSKILIDQSNCTFVLPANCVEKARTLGLPESRIIIAVPDNRFELNDIIVRPFHALHGHKNFAIYQYANMQDCGYLIVFAGKTFFQPGDTVLLQQHLELRDLDVLFVSPTVHNMYTDRSKLLIEATQPSHILPQHYGTYKKSENNLFWTQGYPDELHAALPPDLKKRFHKLAQGTIHPIVS